MENINSFSENTSKEANHSINCSVSCCKHHYGIQDYCVLNSVNIGTHESNPTQSECVDCIDFVCDDQKMQAPQL